MSSGSEEAAGGAGAVSEAEIWAWTEKPEPSLDVLLEARKKVLADRHNLAVFDRKLATLSYDESEGKEDLLKTKGLALWMRGSYVKAYKFLAKLKARGSVAYATAECLLKGEIAIGQERGKIRPDKALEVLKEQANDPAVLLKLECHSEMDNPEGVKKVLDNASDAVRKGAHGKYVHGWLAERDGDLGEAKNQYDAAIAADSGHQGALFRRGRLEALDENTGAAIRDFRACIDAKPLHVGALMNLGLVHENQDEYEQALRCYEAVLDIIPDHPLATLYRKDASSSLSMYYDEEREKKSDRKNQILKIPVTDFELSVRSRNCLAKMKIETLGDLVRKTEADLLSYKNFGETSLAEIKSILDANGLKLGMKDDEEPLPLKPIPSRPPMAPPPTLKDPTILQKSLGDLDFSIRCRKALATLKCNALGDLINYTEQDLLAIRNFGVTSLNEIKKKLSEHGLELRSIDE